MGGLLHVDYNDPGASSYEEYLRTILELNLRPADIDEGFRRMVFNVLAVNQDDHVKNLSFHMTRDGEWSLTPAYDLTFAQGQGYTPVPSDACSGQAGEHHPVRSHRSGWCLWRTGTEPHHPGGGRSSGSLARLCISVRSPFRGRPPRSIGACEACGTHSVVTWLWMRGIQVGLLQVLSGSNLAGGLTYLDGNYFVITYET